MRMRGNTALIIICTFTFKFTVYFTKEVCKNNAHARATSSRPPLFFRGLWRRLSNAMLQRPVEEAKQCYASEACGGG